MAAVAEEMVFCAWQQVDFYGCQVLDGERFLPACVFVCIGKQDASFVASFLHSTKIVSVEPVLVY